MGLRYAMLYAWPGPVYEGKGEVRRRSVAPSWFEARSRSRLTI
jgi:hypothetical protein